MDLCEEPGLLASICDNSEKTINPQSPWQRTLFSFCVFPVLLSTLPLGRWFSKAFAYELSTGKYLHCVCSSDLRELVPCMALHWGLGHLNVIWPRASSLCFEEN